MKKERIFLSGIMSVMMAGLCASASAETTAADLMGDIGPSIPSTLTPEILQDLGDLTTVPSCENPNLTQYNGTTVGRRTFRRIASNLNLQTLLRVRDVHPDIEVVNVQCFLLEPLDVYQDPSNVRFRNDYAAMPARGMAICQPPTLRAATITLPIFIEEGKVVSQFNRYQCVLEFRSRSDIGTVSYEIPRASIDAPDRIRSLSGSEIIVELRGTLGQ